MNIECWEKVNGFWKYDISDIGIVRNCITGKNIKQTPDKDGYLTVTIIDDNGKKRCMKVHRLVCEAFYGEPKKGQICSHIDHDKQNNRIRNLIWETSKENTARDIERGVGGAGRKGSDHFNSKLDEDDVIAIKAMFHTKSIEFSDNRIAEIFGVSRKTINNIRNGVNWSHIDFKVYKLPGSKIHRKLQEQAHCISEAMNESLEQKLERLAERWDVCLEREALFRKGQWCCLVEDDHHAYSATGSTPTEAVDNLIKKLEAE